MKRTRKVYLPRWQRWFFTPFFLAIWLFLTYMQFFSPSADDKPPLVLYIILSVIFIGIGTMMQLMSSGKLPTYIVEETEGNK